MKRWILSIHSGLHKKDGTFVRNEDKEQVYEADDILSVSKMVWLDHFRYGDNIDDYGTCKLGSNSDEENETWTVVRETDDGEFRGIFRLRMEKEDEP